MIDHPFTLYDTGRDAPIAARATEAAMCAVIRDHLRDHPASTPYLVLRVRVTTGETITLDGTKLLAWVLNGEG